MGLALSLDVLQASRALDQGTSVPVDAAASTACCPDASRPGLRLWIQLNPQPWRPLGIGTSERPATGLGKLGMVDVVLFLIGVLFFGWITGVIPAIRVHRARRRIREWAAREGFE